VRAGDAIQRARDYLHDNYAESIALDELAQVAGLSPFHLCRLFRREFGLSPHAYQTHVRLSHAKHQLLRGMPLKDVAAATGFYDQSHFGWHFKRLVGVTPGQYRKSSKNFLYATT
jgi:AraC-like DNA-binding protein